MANLALLMVAAVLSGTSALQLTIAQDHEHVHSDEELTVRCLADTPITHCQVRMWDWIAKDLPVVDLSLGHLSNVVNFTYVGDGLAAGHCGATISLPTASDWGWHGTVQCRVRSTGSDWAYAIMSVMRDRWLKIPLTPESRLVVVPPGGEVRLFFQAGQPLTACSLNRPRLGLVNLEIQTPCVMEADSVCYIGQGLSQHQCGAVIKNVTDKMNGIHWMQMETTTGWELQHVEVIVTKLPDTSDLTANTTVNPDGTTSLQAVCTVSGGRPAANITWLLDGEVVTSGSVVHLVDDRWVARHEEQTTTQQLTLTLEANARPKDLACIIHHIALPSSIPSIKMEVPSLGRENSATPASM